METNSIIFGSISFLLSPFSSGVNRSDMFAGSIPVSTLLVLIELGCIPVRGVQGCLSSLGAGLSCLGMCDMNCCCFYSAALGQFYC